MMSDDIKIRPPSVAGMFYSEKKMDLDQEVAMVLEESKDYNIPGEIVSIMPSGTMTSPKISTTPDQVSLPISVPEVVIPRAGRK